MPKEMRFVEENLKTVQRTLEQQRREAELSEQKKDELILYLAHDIKTPLTSVIFISGIAVLLLYNFLRGKIGVWIIGLFSVLPGFDYDKALLLWALHGELDNSILLNLNIEN